MYRNCICTVRGCGHMLLFCEIDHSVCFTVVYAMLDFRKIAVSAQLGFTSSYTLSFSLPLSGESI